MICHDLSTLVSFQNTQRVTLLLGLCSNLMFFTPFEVFSPPMSGISIPFEPRSHARVPRSAIDQDETPLSMGNRRLDLSSLEFRNHSFDIDNDDSIRAPHGTPVSSTYEDAQALDQSELGRRLSREVNMKYKKFLPLVLLVTSIFAVSVFIAALDSAGLLKPSQIVLCFVATGVASVIVLLLALASFFIKAAKRYSRKTHESVRESVDVLSASSPDPSSNLPAPLVRVDVAVGAETVLTVRSWWPAGQLSESNLHRRAREVAIENARRWVDDRAAARTSSISIPSDASLVGPLLRQCSIVARETQSCAICLDEDGAEVHTLKCGHSFHACCVSAWFAKSQKLQCPLCRDDLSRFCTASADETESRMSADEYSELVNSIHVRSVRIFPDGREDSSPRSTAS